MTQQRLVLLAIILVTGIQGAAAQIPSFSSATEEVLVDVLVTYKGKPVTDLTANDFEIFDNGVPQQIRYVKLQQHLPISITLVFDMSWSVAGTLLGHLKDAANGLLAEFRSDDRAAMIFFNYTVVLGSPLTSDLSQVKLALDKAKPEGQSSLIDASYAGLLYAESQSELPCLIIFSDGHDTASWLTGEEVLDAAKRNNSVVYAASTNTRSLKEGFLKDLTDFTGGALFEVESTKKLASMFLRILQELRQRYLIAYIPTGASGREGWHKLEVRVRTRKASIRARPGYLRNISNPKEQD